jgi:NADH:ubiquinone oxidoreductase subunit E
MSRITERELNSLLHSRPIVPADENLAQRIIEATKSHDQKKQASIVQWLHRIFNETLHFKPAYVMVLTLMIGLSQGYFIAEAMQAMDSNTHHSQNPQDFFYSDRSYP